MISMCPLGVEEVLAGPDCWDRFSVALGSWG